MLCFQKYKYGLLCMFLLDLILRLSRDMPTHLNTEYTCNCIYLAKICGFLLMLLETFSIISNLNISLKGSQHVYIFRIQYAACLIIS